MFFDILSQPKKRWTVVEDYSRQNIFLSHKKHINKAGFVLFDKIPVTQAICLPDRREGNL